MAKNRKSIKNFLYWFRLSTGSSVELKVKPPVQAEVVCVVAAYPCARFRALFFVVFLKVASLQRIANRFIARIPVQSCICNIKFKVSI